MKPLRYYQTFRFKVVASITLVHLILMLTLVIVVVQGQERTMDRVLHKNAESLARMVAIASRNAVLTENLGTLQEIVRYALHKSGVRRVRITNAQRVVLERRGPARVRARWLTVHHTIRVGRYPVGLVTLSLSRSSVLRQMAAARDTGLLLTLVALILGGGAGWLLSRHLTGDLEGLMRDVGQLGGNDGEEERRVQVRRHNEVGVLSEAFNAMLARLARARRQADIERRKQAESERLACLTETAAAIVHEIRNPLASIVSGVELLVDDKGISETDRHEFVAIVRDESRRLNAVLQNFLKWTRPAETLREPGDLNAVVAQVVEMYDLTLNREHRHVFRMELAADLGPVSFDADQIRQVVWNLLLNSADAMKSPGTMTIATAAEEDWVYIRVTDTGSGVQGSAERLFTPFYTTKAEGTGLGLALVRRIANAHGGWVTITNLSPGAMVVFAITREEGRDRHTVGG
ncbi:ATP-binding protein [Acidiferrobacter sp.]|jgi:signal transduction histidine kinase|uniref:two-component system sensor histidine kinase NtrB n=1 Tax=Acidiferrobacter sp. TaxID=1872107 RepID=UPI0026040645|nr:ATP-binding protein [Acidiferrobacter sp.]